MTDSRERDSTPAHVATPDTRSAVGDTKRPPASHRRHERPPDERQRTARRHTVVPSWHEVRRALFGSGSGGGLVERCADDESLIAAALRWHPYLAAYCSHVGRDRLARTPIYDAQDGRGDCELESLREAHESLVPVWRERWIRGLPVAPRDRGRRELRKPDFDSVLDASGAPAEAAERGAHDAAPCSPRRSGVEATHRGAP
jgi:hypothetical protein